MNKVARRESRVLAIQVLFYFLSRNNKVDIATCFKDVLKDFEGRTDDEFAEVLIKTSADNFGKAKLLIRAFAPEYPFEKIAPINRAILIVGIIEMKFIKTPPIVVINEYIELAKQFGEDKSAGFINGVLDAFRKNLGLDGSKD